MRNAAYVTGCMYAYRLVLPVQVKLSEVVMVLGAFFMPIDPRGSNRPVLQVSCTVVKYPQASHAVEPTLVTKSVLYSCIALLCHLVSNRFQSTKCILDG